MGQSMGSVVYVKKKSIVTCSFAFMIVIFKTPLPPRPVEYKQQPPVLPSFPLIKFAPDKTREKEANFLYIFFRFPHLFIRVFSCYV